MRTSPHRKAAARIFRDTLGGVYVSPETKKRLWIAAAVAPFLLPGWRGDLHPVPHEEILIESRKFDADDVIGAIRDGDAPGEEWHLEFMGSRAAAFFDLLNLRGLATHLVPPRFAAHVPPGADALPERADAYYRVETRTRWPWWWPGGGVEWKAPPR
jgi:hypothetical protein